MSFFLFLIFCGPFPTDATLNWSNSRSSDRRPRDCKNDSERYDPSVENHVIGPPSFLHPYCRLSPKRNSVVGDFPFVSIRMAMAYRPRGEYRSSTGPPIRKKRHHCEKPSITKTSGDEKNRRRWRDIETAKLNGPGTRSAVVTADGRGRRVNLRFGEICSSSPISAFSRFFWRKTKDLMPP